MYNSTPDSSETSSQASVVFLSKPQPTITEKPTSYVDNTPFDKEVQQYQESSCSNVSEHRESYSLNITTQLSPPSPSSPSATAPSFLSDFEHNLVGWDSPDDPTNPKNWSNRQKLFVMFLVLITGLMVPTVSTLFAPGQSLMAAEFGLSNKIVKQFTISAYVLGFGWGPLLHAPLSEMYGRKYVIGFSNLLLSVLNVGCSEATSVGMFIAFRTLSGILGCAGMVCGAGIISDMYPPEQTGRATALYLLGPIMGPVCGPILGGFISQRAGWRWCFRVIEIFAFVMAMLFIFIIKETNTAVLLRRKAKRLRAQTGNDRFISIIDSRSAPLTPFKSFYTRLSRAIKLILISPVVQALSLYMAVAYSYLYLFFTTLSEVMTQEYGWSIEISGLAFLGVGTGTLSAVLSVGSTNDKLVGYLAKRNNGVRQPEMRLGPVILGSILIPGALFWYGWAVERHIFWFALVISLFPMGFGLISSLLPIQAYLIDLYSPLGAAASATAALNLLRSTAAAFVPLAIPNLVGNLGYGWGYSLLGFVSILFCTCTSLLFIKYGQRIREQFPPRV
ncbi:major facilitator superfamily domain-containing protein [Lipomyces oligophaga]|uniref:major facilitator superfamily domain-containing protein n=1 Tax=Lipomyces oligophaga TaxID=45792 RepID=UPI0034CE7C36